MAYAGRIYYERNKKADFTEPQFWILSSKESKDDEWIEYDNQEIHTSVAQYHAISFIDAGPFQDYIDVKPKLQII